MLLLFISFTFQFTIYGQVRVKVHEEITGNKFSFISKSEKAFIRSFKALKKDSLNKLRTGIRSLKKSHRALQKIERDTMSSIGADSVDQLMERNAIQIDSLKDIKKQMSWDSLMEAYLAAKMNELLVKKGMVLPPGGQDVKSLLPGMSHLNKERPPSFKDFARDLPDAFLPEQQNPLNELKKNYYEVTSSKNIGNAPKSAWSKKKPGEKISFGGSMDLYLKDNPSVLLAPQIGYRAGEKWLLGTQLRFKFNSAYDLGFVEKDTVVSNTLGLFAEYYVQDKYILYSRAEYLTLRNRDTVWAVFGVGRKFDLRKNLEAVFLLTYNPFISSRDHVFKAFRIEYGIRIPSIQEIFK